MKNILKRSLSLFLALVMVFGMVPVNAFAAENDTETEITSVMETEAQLAAPTEASVGETEAVATTAPAETAAPAEAPTVAPTEAATEAAAEEPTEAATVVTEEATVETTEETIGETTEATEEKPDYAVKVEGWANAQSDLTEEALFNAYAESVLFGGAMAAYGNQAGSNLSGNTRVAYEALKPVLAKIASGKRSSAIITLGDQLGEVTFDDGTTETCNAEVSATFNVLEAEVDGDALLQALLTDMPYELYWFDKVTGIEWTKVSCNSGVFYKFSFAVGDSYQESEYTVDTARTGAATAAVATAKAVVAQVKADVTAKTDYTDYDILLAYKNWICNAVSYNDAAAEKNNFSEETDPWQIIYVFDNNSSTNVVCEGYSKAFQYLCELTDFFKDNHLACYTVTGTMTAGNQGGAHMWNIVHLDGKNYLVDVTNSDEDTIGRNGGLFLAGATGSVENGYTVAIDGNNSATYTYDQDTRDLWDDNDLTLSAENYPIPAENIMVVSTDSTSADAMTQEAFVQAMEACEDGFYSMSNASVEITESMEIPEGTVVWMSNGSSLTVSNGATLTVNGQLTAESSTITVEAGATLENNFCLSLAHGGNDSGKITIEGKLINNDSVIVGSGTLALNGEYVDDANTEIQSFIGSVSFDWIHASITDMDKIKGLVYETVVTMEDELRSAVVCKEGDQFVNIQGFIALSKDLTIPYGVAVNTGYSYDSSVADYQNGLIVPNGVTLINQGSMNVINGSKLEVLSGGTLDNQNSIWVAEGCALLCEGSFTGTAPYGNGKIDGTGETEDGDTDEKPIASFEIDYNYYMFFDNGNVFYNYNAGTQEEPNWVTEAGSLPEGITFDKDNNVLTLNNQSLQYIGAFHKYYHEDTDKTEYGLTSDSWTIRLEGDNTISNTMELWGGLNTTFTGTGSLTIGSGAKVYFSDNGLVTISEGTTLALAAGAQISTGNGAVVEGKITVDGTVCTMASALSKQMADLFDTGGDVNVSGIVYLDQDMEVSLGENGGELTILNGGKIVIPNGKTMTIYNPTNVMGGAEIEVLSGGKLTIEGSMGVFNQGKVTVRSGGTIYTSGNVWIDTEGLVLVEKGGIAQYHDNNCWIDGYYVNENEGEPNTYLYGIYLDWSDDGWYLDAEKEPERFRGTTAFQDSYVIFYAHTFDFKTMQWKNVPVVPTTDSDKYTITKLTELEDVKIKEGEENKDYFVQISAYHSLSYWQDTINFTVGNITMKDYRFDFYDRIIAAYTSETPSKETVLREGAKIGQDVYLLPLNENYTITGVDWKLEDWCEDYGEKYCDGEKLLTATELANGGLKFTVNSKFVEYCKYDGKDFCVKFTAHYKNVDDTEGSYNWDGDIWFNPADDSMPEPKTQLIIDGGHYNVYDTGMVTKDYFTGDYDEEGNEIWDRQFKAAWPEGVTYDLESNTLTLTNADLEEINIGYDCDDGRIMPSKNFTLKLVGENKLENSKTSPFNTGNVNVIIAGTGSLKVLAHNDVNNDGAYSAMQLFDGSNLTIQDSANVYVCTDGKGYYHDENGKPFNADLNCISGGDQKGTITVKDSATLTTRVPDGKYVVDEISEHPMRYNVICSMNIKVQDSATLNTDMLLMMDGDTLTQTGGTINVEAPESVFLLEDGTQWHNYEGIYACNGSTINLSGGVMNISQATETNGSGFFYGIQVTDEGTGKGSALNITGGTLNITGNAYDGYGIIVDTCSVMNMSGGTVNLKNEYTVANNKYWSSILVSEPYNGDDTNGVLNLSGGTINAENWAWIFTLNMTGGQFNLKNNEKISLSEDNSKNNENNSLLRARMYVTFGSIDGGEINITNGTLINRNNFGMGGENDGQKYGTGKITIRNTMERVVGLENLTYFPVNAGTLDIETNHFPAIETSGTFHQMGGVVRAVDKDRAMNAIHSTGSVLLNDGEMSLSGYIGVMQFEPGVAKQSEDDSETGDDEYTPMFCVTGGKLNIDAEYRGIWNRGITQLNGGEVNITITNKNKNDEARAIVSEYKNWKSEDKSDAKLLIGGNAKVTVNEAIQAFELEMTGGKLTMKGDNVVKLDVNAGFISDGEINITNGVLVNQMNFSIDGGEITIDNTTGSTNEDPLVGLINNLYLPINGGKVDIKTNYCSPIINNGTYHQMGGEVNAETTLGAALWNRNVFYLNKGTLNLKGQSGICATTDKGENSVTTGDAIVQVSGGELNIDATYRGIWGDLPIDLSHDVSETGMADSATVNITVTDDAAAGIYTTNTLNICSDVVLNINATGESAKGIWADNATVTVEDTPDVTITAKGATLYSENDSATDTGFTFTDVEVTNQNHAPLSFKSQPSGDGYVHTVSSSPVYIRMIDADVEVTVNSWEELKALMGDNWIEEANYGVLHRSVKIGKSFTIPADIHICCKELVIPNKVTLTVSGNLHSADVCHISVEKGGKLTVIGKVDVYGSSKLDVAGTLTIDKNTFMYVYGNAKLEIAGNLTISQNAILKIWENAQLDVAAGATLTDNGNLLIQDNAQLDVAAGATLTNNGYLHLNQNIGNPDYGTGHAYISGTYKQGKNGYVAANVHSVGSVTGIETKYINLNAAVYPDGGDEVLAMFLNLYEENQYASGYVNLFGYTISKDMTIPKGVSMECGIMIGENNLDLDSLTIADGVTLTIEGQLFVQLMDNGVEELSTTLINYGNIVVNEGGILYVTGELENNGTITNNGGKILPAATKVTITKADETEVYDISQKDEDGKPTVTAKLNVALDSKLSQVTWTSSNSKIVDASQIEKDADGNWIVPFVGDAIGKVTLTATANDGGKASAKITLNTCFINDGKLTATLSDTVVAGSLQPGEKASLQVYCGGELLDANKLTFKAAKDGIVELDESTGEVTGLLNKSGSVKITATLKDDPKKRSVSITVKTVVAQIMGIEIWDTFPNFETELTGSTYITEMSAEEQILTLGADLNYADYAEKMVGEELPGATKSNIQWATTDAKVAKITANADGTATVTIPKNASGMATITVTAKDSLKQQATVDIIVKDYTPKLRSSTITMNTMQYAGQWLNLLESYDNAITDVQVMKDTKGTPDTRFGTDYDVDYGWYIYANDTLKNGTYKVKLLVESVQHPDGDYLDLTITVKNSIPKITVTQNGKFNLFYTNSELPITVTAEGYNIDAIVNDGESDFEVSFHEGWDDEENTSVVNCFIEFSYDYVASTMSGYKKPNSKIKVEVWLEGYREPVSTTITVQTETVQPTLRLVNGDMSFNTALDDVTGYLQIPICIYNDTEDREIDLYNETMYQYWNENNELVTDYMVMVSSTNGGSMPDGSEQFCIYYPTFPTKTGTNKVTIRCQNWTQAVTLSSKVTISTTKPKAKLSATTLKLNPLFKNMAYATATVTSSIADYPIVDVEFDKNPAGTENIQLNYVDGKIEAYFLEGDAPAAKTYSFTATPYAQNKSDQSVPLDKITVKVQVNNTKPTVKLGTSTLKLNSKFPAGQTASTAVTLSQPEMLTYLKMGERGKFVTTAKEGTDAYEQASLITVVYQDGQLTASFNSDTRPKKGTYTYTATPKINGVDLKDVTVKVTVTEDEPTVKLSTSSVKLNTYFLERDYSDETAYITPVLTNKTGIPMEISGFEIEYANEEDADALNIQYVYWDDDGHKGELKVNLRNTEEMKSKYTVKLYTEVKYADGNYKTLTTPLTLTINTYNKTPSVSLSASGKLDTLNRATGITYTINSITNAIGEIYDVELLDAETGEESDLFDVEWGEKNAKGKQTFTLKLKENQTYEVKTYKIKLRYGIAGKDVVSSDISVKVTQSALKISVTSGTTQFYQSEGKLRFTLQITSPADTYFDAVFVNTDKTSKELLEAMDIDVENGGYYYWGDDFQDEYWNWINFGGSVPYPGRLTAGKSYNLYLDVYPRNCAYDKFTTVKVTVKVNK